jgi:hypothetical protein
MRLLLTTNLFLVLAINCYAYLDPGSGSYIIQMIIAAALGGAYTIKMYWYKIKSFFVKTEKTDLEKDNE